VSKIIGVDLGTSRSAVAIMRSGSPFVIPAADGSPTIPSLVLFSPDQKYQQASSPHVTQNVTLVRTF